MHRIFSSGIAALVMIATGLPATAEPASPIAASSVSAPNMDFSFSAPFVSSSGLLGDNHNIQVMVVGMALEDLTVSIPPGMSRFSEVRVRDSAGQTIPATINASQSQVQVTFEQPVQPGRTIALDISGVNVNDEALNSSILLYGVMGRRTGLRESIPIGTARIQLPDPG